MSNNVFTNVETRFNQLKATKQTEKETILSNISTIESDLATLETQKDSYLSANNTDDLQETLVSINAKQETKHFLKNKLNDSEFLSESDKAQVRSMLSDITDEQNSLYATMISEITPLLNSVFNKMKTYHETAETGADIKRLIMATFGNSFGKAEVVQMLYNAERYKNIGHVKVNDKEVHIDEN